MESSMLTSVIDSNLYASVLASGTTRAYVYLYVISQGSLFKRRPRTSIAFVASDKKSNGAYHFTKVL
jgi:hypothetical protein